MLTHGHYILWTSWFHGQTLYKRKTRYTADLGISVVQNFPGSHSIHKNCLYSFQRITNTEKRFHPSHLVTSLPNDFHRYENINCIRFLLSRQIIIILRVGSGAPPVGAVWLLWVVSVTFPLESVCAGLA